MVVDTAFVGDFSRREDLLARRVLFPRMILSPLLGGGCENAVGHNKVACLFVVAILQPPALFTRLVCMYVFFLLGWSSEVEYLCCGFCPAKKQVHGMLLVSSL